MSKRAIRVKQANRLRKSLRNELPAFFDLQQWLVDHKHAKTRKEAKEIMLAGRVRNGSHKIGVKKDKVFTALTALDVARGIEPKLEEQDVLDPYIPIAQRADLIVTE